MPPLSKVPVPLNSPLGPTLETPRLWLRPPVAEDFEGYCAFYADEAAMMHLGGTVAPPMVWRTLRSVAGQWAADGFGMFSVIEKASDEWVGRIGPQFPYQWPGHEVGWGLPSAHWGKGYAVEAAAASLDYAFDVLGWDRAVHVIAPENLSSIKVAQRLGSTHGGPGQLPPPHAPDKQVDIWGQTRDDWARNRHKVMS